MRFYVFSTYGVAFVYFWWGVLEGGRGDVLSILSMFSYLIVLFFIF